MWIDYQDYEQKVRKLMDSHIQSAEVRPITGLVNIFEADQFDAEVARLTGPVAQADTIANRIKKTASEKMEQDPAFYKKFSHMIDETITAYQAGRLDELAYLQKSTDLLHQMRSGKDEATPDKLLRYKHAPAYYGVIRELLSQSTQPGETLSRAELVVDMAIKLEELIERRKVRDWVNNLDVQNGMKLDMEDYLLDIRDHYNVPLAYGEIDLILDSVIAVARQRDQL